MKLDIEPKCKNGWPQYISSEGHWFPCWFVSHVHRYWQEDFFNKNLSKFDLNVRSLEEILTDPVLKDLEEIWREGDPNKVPFKCREFCSKTSEKI